MPKHPQYNLITFIATPKYFNPPIFHKIHTFRLITFSVYKSSFFKSPYLKGAIYFIAEMVAKLCKKFVRYVSFFTHICFLVYNTSLNRLLQRRNFKKALKLIDAIYVLLLAII